MRFYIGQPVVCIWSKEEWLVGVPLLWQAVPLPALGQRYTLRCYELPLGGHDYVGIHEITNYCGEPLWFEETGFAPITESQVRSIVTEALRVPRKEDA